mmetsp:Transcript_14205/g.61856  ORF Transcript_14205/g.61856 Transcript_14205/m.61856 type:complete len:273 (+) Transcript_14205:1150-1968(+)
MPHRCADGTSRRVAANSAADSAADANSARLEAIADDDPRSVASRPARSVGSRHSSSAREAASNSRCLEAAARAAAPGTVAVPGLLPSAADDSARSSTIFDIASAYVKPSTVRPVAGSIRGVGVSNSFAVLASTKFRRRPTAVRNATSRLSGPRLVGFTSANICRRSGSSRPWYGTGFGWKGFAGFPTSIGHVACGCVVELHRGLPHGHDDCRGAPLTPSLRGIDPCFGQPAGSSSSEASPSASAAPRCHVASSRLSTRSRSPASNPCVANSR